MPNARRQKQRRKSITNPNGANQWIADPRQQLFLAYYLDPKSSTFSNGLQSGLRAGFAEEYAANILNLMPEWLSVKLGNSAMLLKAERNLDEALDYPTKTQAMGAFGPLFKKEGKGKTAKKTPILSHNIGLIKVKTGVSQFIAERVGRNVYGKDEPKAGDVYNVIILSDEQRTKMARRIIERDSRTSSGSEGASN